MADEAARAASIRFAGYAAIFDRLDNGGDVIRPGAFQRSLERTQTIPLLWQHRGAMVVGSIEHLKEDKRGLQVIGRIHTDGMGRQLANELRRGAITGLSFGYRIVDAARREHHRELRQVDLIEVSVVKRPMQPLARIHKLAD